MTDFPKRWKCVQQKELMNKMKKFLASFSFDILCFKHMSQRAIQQNLAKLTRPLLPLSPT